MEDSRIVDLFLERSQRAVAELSGKYGRLIYEVSYNVLGNREDARECENDTYMGVWNSIPPNRPEKLKAYVCRIARNLSVKRLRSAHAKKRSALVLAMEELSEEISVPGVEAQLSAVWLGGSIDRFLDEADRESRVVFVRRFYLGQSIHEIAEALNIRENTVSKRLSRTKLALKEYLEKEGHVV